MDRITWSDKVKQRDEHKCVICGRTDCLQAHHIKPAFLYPECRYDVDNGITLCKSCHQNQHGGHFAGYRMVPVNGYDPDPENRMEQYKKVREQKADERNKIYAVWGTNKDNGKIVFEAAEALGIDPRVYIAEAVYMRLVEDGFDCDINLIVPEFKKSSIRESEA